MDYLPVEMTQQKCPHMFKAAMENYIKIWIPKCSQRDIYKYGFVLPWLETIGRYNKSNKLCFEIKSWNNVVSEW